MAEGEELPSSLIMELDILKPLTSFYTIYKQMKKNDQVFPDTLYRLSALIDLVTFIKQKEGRKSDGVNAALKKLDDILKSARDLMDRFSEAYAVTQFFKARDYRAEFDRLNKSLTDAFVTLSGALHVDQDKKLSQQEEELHEQKEKLARYEEKFSQQEVKLYVQQEKLADLQRTLQSLESKLEHQSSRFSCILQ